MQSMDNYNKIWHSWSEFINITFTLFLNSIIMSEINMDEETEKKLDEIFNSIKIECKVPSSECE